MAQSEKARKEKEAQAKAALPPTMTISTESGTGSSDAIINKDPHTELTRTQMELGTAYGDYEGLLPQVTNFDHPMQAMSIDKDMTELDFMRALGLPEEMYNIMKGKSKKNQDGTWDIRATGFNGLMRARMGLVYPGIEGMEFHPREQVFRSTRTEQSKKDTQKSLWQRITGTGGE